MSPSGFGAEARTGGIFLGFRASRTLRGGESGPATFVWSDEGGWKGRVSLAAGTNSYSRGLQKGADRIGNSLPGKVPRGGVKNKGNLNAVVNDRLSDLPGKKKAYPRRYRTRKRKANDQNQASGL